MKTMKLLGVASLALIGQGAMATDGPCDAVCKRAEALVAQMTPEEKASQLVTYFAFPAPADTEVTNQRVAQGAGSLLFVSDPNEVNRLQRLALANSRLKIPVLFAFDVVHGFSTMFPVPIGQAASWDPAMIERNQAIAAQEASAVGIRWTFAPMIDIARDGRWGRIVESAGEDPFLTSAIAAAQVRGFQGSRIGMPGRVISGPKHFVAYGAAAGGRDYDEVDVSDSALHNVYLPPFKAAIDAGAGNIMAAYMGVNGVPATANKWLLSDVLRRDWGFRGWVVSDGEGVNNLVVHGVAADKRAAAIKALDAGVDMEMAMKPAANGQLPGAVAAGAISQPRIDQSVRRVIEAKMRLGLFERPFVNEKRALAAQRSPAALTAARIAAERSAVLLRNEGSLLPLDRKKVRSIAVIGRLASAGQDANGPWTFDQNTPARQSLLEGIKDKAGPGVTVGYAPGVSLPPRLNASLIDPAPSEASAPLPQDDTQGIAEAVALAKHSDVAVVVVGEPKNWSGENASRSTLTLPGRQQDLLDAVAATGKPVVVLLMNGRPLDLGATQAKAILELWYPGSRGGDAAGNLLFGEAVPGGKLPFTWPRSVGQVPIFYAHLASHEPTHAARRYLDADSSPAYPFGFGMSYTRFTYGQPAVDKPVIGPDGTVTVAVTVRNAGARSGDEVVQLYLHQRTGSAARPVRELKGFERISLAPGEARVVKFNIGPEHLRYWNAASRDWVIDPATFDVAVGTDSTAPFQTSFTVATKQAASPSGNR